LLSVEEKHPHEKSIPPGAGHRRRIPGRLATAAPAFAGKTLDAVKQRGTVKCGVTNGVAGFSAP
jgi:hypothetical protein